MRFGTGAVLRLTIICLFLWLGGRFLLPLCLPFLLGTALALAAEPVVSLLWGRLHVPRGLASAVGVMGAFLGLALLLVLVLAFLIRELGMLTGAIPDLTETARWGILQARNWLQEMTDQTPESIRPLLQQNVDNLFSGGNAMLDRVFSYVLGLAGSILGHIPDSALGLGTAVISGFMISVRLPRIRKWCSSRFPRERMQALSETLRRLKNALGAWLSAQLRLAGVTLLILLAGFVILRIPNAPLWAAGICLVDAFPVLGTGTVLLPWSVASLLQGDRARAVGLAAVYVVIALVRSVLEPKLVGKQLGLDPLVTLVALYAGYRLWGIGGMILSPMLAVTVVQLLPGQRNR